MFYFLSLYKINFGKPKITMKKTYKNNRFPHWTATEAAGGFHVYQGKSFESLVPAELIIGSPDWVEEKDFVITAFIQEDGAKCVLNNHGTYDWDCEIGGCDWSLESRLEHVKAGGFEIFSVLSNGIEWKLQDKSEQGEIEKFWIDGDEMKVSVKFVIGKTGCISVTNDYNISLLTPAKKVILTTEDGESITDENKLLRVVTESFELGDCLAKHYQSINRCKYFSTREAAESYISQNKKKYSENDILEVIEGASWCKEAKDYLITKLNEK